MGVGAAPAVNQLMLPGQLAKFEKDGEDGSQAAFAAAALVAFDEDSTHVRPVAGGGRGSGKRRCQPPAPVSAPTPRYALYWVPDQPSNIVRLRKLPALPAPEPSAAAGWA